MVGLPRWPFRLPALTKGVARLLAAKAITANTETNMLTGLGYQGTNVRGAKSVVLLREVFEIAAVLICEAESALVNAVQIQEYRLGTAWCGGTSI